MLCTSCPIYCLPLKTRLYCTIFNTNILQCLGWIKHLVYLMLGPCFVCSDEMDSKARGLRTFQKALWSGELIERRNSSLESLCFWLNVSLISGAECTTEEAVDTLAYLLLDMMLRPCRPFMNFRCWRLCQRSSRYQFTSGDWPTRKQNIDGWIPDRQFPPAKSMGVALACFLYSIWD